MFRNEGSVREYIKPVITFSPAGGTTALKIINHNDGDREFLLEKIQDGQLIEVNNNNCIIKEANFGANLYDGFNFNFFRLVHGDNNLTVTGDGTLTISGRLLHNVAG